MRRLGRESGCGDGKFPGGTSGVTAVQSSAILAVRGAIMLLFLIAVPLLAIFGRSLPDVIRVVVERHLGWKPAEARIASALEGAPRFGEPLQGRPQQASQPGADNSYQAPRALASTLQAPGPALSTGFPQARSASPQPPGQSVNFEVQPAADARTQPNAPTNSEVPPNPDEIQERLKQLGATWYRLDQWGDSGELYRFACRMEVSPGSNLDRHFESVAQTPDEALIGVLRQVEQWRSGR